MDDTFDFYYDEIKLTENILYNFLVFIFQCYCQEKKRRQYFGIIMEYYVTIATRQMLEDRSCQNDY